jgi:HPr kinase/phosphorylase
VLARLGEGLVARAPAALRGLIEARGVGVLPLDALDEAPLALAVDLDRAPAARMPQRHTIAFLGVALELISGRDVPNVDAALTILLQTRGAAPEPDGIRGA